MCRTRDESTQRPLTSSQLAWSAAEPIGAAHPQFKPSECAKKVEGRSGYLPRQASSIAMRAT